MEGNVAGVWVVQGLNLAFGNNFFYSSNNFVIMVMGLSSTPWSNTWVIKIYFTFLYD